MPLQDDGPSACIDENAVLDFVQGRMDAAEAARVDEHADGCLACRMAIEVAVRAFRERATGVENGGPLEITRFAPGEKLADRYRIVRFIARGGMGEVYEAEDEILGTRIAVKTIAATIADNSDAARRLKQEVNLARRITHPNVCRIFDLGTHGTGTQRAGPVVRFITMELIAGVSLAQRLREQGRYSPEAALPIVKAMAAAIGAAHRAAVVHRDFKTDNVMLAPDGTGGERVVVMDFGLARNTSLDTHDSTQGRGLEGTLAYMAPEQLEGQSARQPADIYGLGLVMYEMLTGQLPFAPAPGGAWLPAACRRAVEPIPPVRTLVPEIDVRWNDVIARCLQKEVERRPASADDVVVALLGQAAPEPPAPATAAPTEDPPAPEVAPSRPAGHRWRWVTAAALGVAGALVVAGVVHRRAPARTSGAPPESAAAPAPAPPPAAAPPAPGAPPNSSAAVLPGRLDADLLEARRLHAAPRPIARPPAHRERVATSGPEPSKGSSAAPPNPDAGQAAATARRRSDDPDDGFIFK